MYNNISYLLDIIYCQVGKCASLLGIRMLSSELHNRTTFLPFNMETHLVSRSADNIDIAL